jgi:cephalosporin hydroxylase
MIRRTGWRSTVTKTVRRTALAKLRPMPGPRCEGPPPPVSIELSGPMRAYWLDRVHQHTNDSYAGIRMSKFPEDLRVYEHLLWSSRADVVIEIGAQFGGSALWFRDRLRCMASYGRIARPLVVSIDIDIEPARTAIADVDPSHASTIKLIGADVCDPDLPARVQEFIPAGSRCLVVEDAAHVYETTRAALEGFARFVPVDGFFVVEDGCVDIEEMRIDWWPRGVLPALNDWLQTPVGREFKVRGDLEAYGLSCHPQGFLQRVSAPQARVSGDRRGVDMDR